MAIKRFGFLITGCDELLVTPSWGDSREVAQEFLVRSLNSSYSVVRDVEVISEFVQKEEKEIAELPENHKQLISQYIQDLSSIKTSLQNSEGGYEVGTSFR